jgi:succinate dehydrogenase / fumarate reductase iron-sulfur subunit
VTTLHLTVDVWRQPSPGEPGDFVSYDVPTPTRT